MPSFKSKTRAGLDSQWPQVGAAINRYDDGKGIELVVRRPSKTREQEKRFNAMVQDISNAGAVEYQGKRVCFADHPGKPFDVAKAFIIVWLEADLRAQGKSLKHPSTCTIEPVSMMPLMLRASSTQFSVKECGWAIEFCNVICAENKIPLSDPESKNYEQWAQEG